MRSLVCFPMDALQDYLRKGEVKRGCLNPCGLFGEVHVMNFSSSFMSDEDKERAGVMASPGKLIVHEFLASGKIGVMCKRKEVLKEVRSINPDVIRAFGVFHEGFLASYVAKCTGIPLVCSVHGNYTHHNWLVLRKENFLQGAKMVLFKTLFLRGIVKEVDEFIFVYNQAFDTIKGFNVPEERKHLIHNKVYQGELVKKNEHKDFRIIYVGNFLKVKNQMFLLEVVKEVPGVKLTLVGKGYMKKEVERRVFELGINDRVSFIESIPNSELGIFLDAHDLFMSATLIQEISIPVIEAMSRGLPVLHRKPLEGERVDVFHKGMDLVNFDVESYKKELLRLMNDKELLSYFSELSLNTWYCNRGELMEEKEADVYRKVLL